VSGNEMLIKMARVFNIIWGWISNDFDNDGVHNHVDNCQFACNRWQDDVDNDGIGDCCDDDIDWDGIPNQVGVVGPQGKVSAELYAVSQDNCLFVANPDQEKSWDGPYGDACDPENPQAQAGQQVVASVSAGTVPLVVDFTLEGVWEIVEAEWDFGDN
jgi:hypothetical protein